MKLDRLVIANPSGNITGIVFDRFAREDMPAVGASVQDAFPTIEQVLFVEKRKYRRIHAQMAGDEFCGNGAAALGFVLANGQLSRQQFTMSGLPVDRPVIVDVRPGHATFTVQTGLRSESALLGGVTVSIAHIEDKEQGIDGISHAVMFPEHPFFNTIKAEAAKLGGVEVAKRVLQDLGLTARKASGLMLVERIADGLKVTPYVYVRDANTTIRENACATGSIAVISILGRDVALQQPSGEYLHVALRPVGNLIEAKVGGSMAIQWDGPVSDMQEIVPQGRFTTKTTPSSRTANLAALTPGR